MSASITPPVLSVHGTMHDDDDVTVQYDGPERQTCAELEIEHDPSRGGRQDGFIHLDETQRTAENPVEIKSATGENVSTARDVTLATIEQWRRKYWLVTKGKNYAVPGSGKCFRTDESYVLHPGMLEPFFSAKAAVISAEMDKVDQTLAYAIRGGAPAHLVEHTRKVGVRGTSLNNPKIPMDLVRMAGHALGIDPRLGKERLREFVRENPLGRAAPEMAGALHAQLGLFAA